jgi:anti-sigma B factor antagonist
VPALSGVPVSLGPRPDQVLSVDVRENMSPYRSLVHVRGELDFATAPRLERDLDALVGQGVHHLIVDLTHVSFCDLHGLRVLLRVDRELRSRGARLTLLGPCKWVSLLLTVLDLRDQLRIETGADGDGAGANGDGAGPTRAELGPANSRPARW